MVNLLKNTMKWLLGRYGYEVVKSFESQADFGSGDLETIRSVKPYTMTSPQMVYGLIQAVKYVVKNDIPGALVECGVWRGGSMMAVAKTLLNLNRSDRDLWLFDTFEGMTEPSHRDLRRDGVKASDLWEKSEVGEDSSDWARCSLDEVKDVIYDTGYVKERIHFVRGKVEDTIPDNAPDVVSLLRLDTDWYESTKHELIHLFPRLSRGGVIIIDDYGYWQGSREAVDEYVSQNNIQLLLHRIDNSAGRFGVKI